MDGSWRFPCMPARQSCTYPEATQSPSSAPWRACLSRRDPKGLTANPWRIQRSGKGCDSVEWGPSRRWGILCVVAPARRLVPSWQSVAAWRRRAPPMWRRSGSKPSVSPIRAGQRCVSCADPRQARRQLRRLLSPPRFSTPLLPIPRSSPLAAGRECVPRTCRCAATSEKMTPENTCARRHNQNEI